MEYNLFYIHFIQVIIILFSVGCWGIQACQFHIKPIKCTNMPFKSTT